MVHRAGVKVQAADALPRPPTEETDDSDIDDDIPVISVGTSAQSRLGEVTCTTPDKALMKTKEPNLPTLDEFCCTQNTESCCDKVWPTVEILGLSLDFGRNGILVRLSLIGGAMKKLYRNKCALLFYIWPTIRLSMVTQKSVICTTSLDVNTFDPICWRMYIVQPDTAKIASELENVQASTSAPAGSAKWPTPYFNSYCWPTNANQVKETICCYYYRSVQWTDSRGSKIKNSVYSPLPHIPRQLGYQISNTRYYTIWQRPKTC